MKIKKPICNKKEKTARKSYPVLKKSMSKSKTTKK